VQSALSAMAIPGYIPGDYFRRIQDKSGSQARQQQDLFYRIWSKIG
jgi:hypothetical protein